MPSTATSSTCAATLSTMFNVSDVMIDKEEVSMTFKVVTMPPAAAQMMMKAVDFLLLVPYPSDLLYPYSGDTSTLQSTL